MHEWSLMQAVVEALLEFAGRNGFSRISRVVVEVNEVSQLEEDILREAYSVLTENTIAEGSTLVIEKVPARFTCNSCGYTFSLEEARRALERLGEYAIPDEEGTLDMPTHYIPAVIHGFLRCPRCGSRDIWADMTSSLRVKAVEGER
ncbi:hydrogenase maturation nickel metallochaperone HypA/HybF [Thermofilum pendens]|uniref:Hydrogenase maturation factor HypA n=1 Tax=Thermofilum pendens (strain DSM 2475 / Hrk 5) TaxID=368408 RepID=A1RXS0_THEPD|nr:hydrogenase maturation nickel metallochaperone HypA [Thermofilum pendens]ABL78000.1 hydrogenase expression/synthesis, HypA [Thermofilum pendens Hrk 5]